VSREWVLCDARILRYILIIWYIGISNFLRSDGKRKPSLVKPFGNNLQFFFALRPPKCLTKAEALRLRARIVLLQDNAHKFTTHKLEKSPNFSENEIAGFKK